MVPVVGWYKNSTASVLWFELRGSTITAIGPTAVDLDASLAEQDVTMPIEGSSPPEYLTFHLLRRVPNDALALDSVKANDADVVHKTGDETIEGVKTFSNGIVSDYDIYNANGFITTMGVWLQDIASGYVGGDNYDDHLIHIRTATDTALGLPSGDVTIPRANGMVALTSDIDGKQDNLPYPTNAIPYAAISGKPSLATVATSGSYNDLSNKPTIPTVPTNVSSFNNDAGYLTGYTESDPTISAWSKAASKPSYTASDVGAYSSADGTSLANIVNTWEGYWDGTNVIFEVTNYYGNTSGEIPRLRIRELREGAWQTVWDEANKFQVCETNIMSNVVAYVTGEVDGVKDYASGNFAPMAWGTVTDKGTTNVVGNSVWMTAPETYFAGGTEYQRVAVGSGMICVLTDNGALAKTTGEPGTFRFQDEGGTNYFGFAKSGSYTIGCSTDGITVSGNLVTLRYDVIMGGGDVPIVYWRQSLTSGEWTQLNNADGTATQGAPYTVTWYTSGGSYYAAINCGVNASGFFKAETSVAGDVVFETNMKMRIDGGLECPNTATGVMGVVRPSYNGSTVIWTWSAK